MKGWLIGLGMLLTVPLLAQTSLSGKVVDAAEEPLVGASVYVMQRPELGGNTDVEGRFTLNVALQPGDTLAISYLGYQTRMYTLDRRSEFYFYVQMTAVASVSKEVVVQASRALTEEFSLKKLNRMDIYLNPLAAADPLKAVATLPASTNTTETATVELRGSSQNRSIVYLNGVPVYKPVRTTTLNDLGFFSLFNTEMIDELLVYAMAPPLNFGNASSGLVDIRSVRQLAGNSTSLSLSLAGAGVFANRQLGRKDRFVQVYGNWQYADAFLRVNRKSFPNLQDFNTRDVGANLHLGLSKQWKFNLYQYFVDENNRNLTSLFGNESVASSRARRYFNVADLNYYADRFSWRINAGYDQSASAYEYALTQADETRRIVYFGTDASHFLSDRWKMQYGISGQTQRIAYDNTLPRYFFALEPDQPVVISDTLLRYSYAEAFGLLKYSTDRWSTQIGIRQHINDLELPNPLSWQINTAYQLSEKHHLLAGFGTYHNLQLPSVNNPNVDLLGSVQLHTEYRYRSPKWETSLALFHKWEDGERVDFIFSTDTERRIWGIEAEVAWRPSYTFEFRLANISVHNRLLFAEQTFTVNPNLSHFIKAGLIWRPDFITLALQYIGRPGAYYSPIVGSEYRPDLGVYEPLFANTLNGQQYGPYHNISVNVNKLIYVGQTSLILYGNLNNIFDHPNQQNIRYTDTYQVAGFDSYQRRMVYFGMVWQW